MGGKEDDWLKHNIKELNTILYSNKNQLRYERKNFIQKYNKKMKPKKKI